MAYLPRMKIKRPRAPRRPRPPRSPRVRTFAYGVPDKRLRDAGIEQRDKSKPLPIDQFRKVSGLIYIHPNDFTIGKEVWFYRKGHINFGIVTKVFDTMLKPARVRHNGRNYTPSVYDFCDHNGEKPTKVVKLMQSHSPAALAGMASFGSAVHEAVEGVLAHAGEYADGRPRPWQYTCADYMIRQRFKPGKKAVIDRDSPWGIYLRDYNVCLAEFAPNSSALREALDRMFNACHVQKLAAARAFKDARTKLPKGHAFRHVSDGD